MARPDLAPWLTRRGLYSVVAVSALVAALTLSTTASPADASAVHGAAASPAAESGVHAAASPAVAAGVHAAQSAPSSGWVGKSVGGSTISDVICPSTTICFASAVSGSSAVMLASANDGATWSVQLSVPRNGMDAVSCFSVTSCVAVGGYSASATSSVGIAYATTNGTTWHALTLPAGTAEVGWVKCLAPDYCWADTSKNAGLRTIDGGLTWTAMPLLTTSPTGASIYNNDLAFVSATRGFVVSDTACDSYTSPCQGFIQDTTNGGASWSWESTPAGMSALIDISCPSTTECLAVGSSGIFGQGYMTFNGGATWAPTNVPFGMLSADGVACPDTESCYIVGFSSFYPDAAAIFATTDAGATWQVQPVSGGISYLNAVSCATASNCVAGGGINATSMSGVAVTTDGGAPNPGYRMVASDGGIFSFNAPFYGSTGGIHLNQPVVGMANDPATSGYWLVASDGGIFSFNAPFFGSTGAVHLDKPVVGMVPTSDGGGYWMVASDGGVFSFGDAHFWGSTGGVHLNKPIVGMALEPLTGGYYLVASDGGNFSFNAPFLGSTGGITLNKPIVGMALDPATGGYWLVAADGGIFSFDAPFYGSTGGITLNQPIVGMQPTPDGHGYWLVAADGGVFSFGDARFLGSTGGIHLNKPVVGMSGDYWSP